MLEAKDALATRYGQHFLGLQNRGCGPVQGLRLLGPRHSHAAPTTRRTSTHEGFGLLVPNQ